MASTDLALKVSKTDDMDVMQLGRTMAASGFFADSKEAAQAVVKILAGRELGIPPVAAMMGVNIIKGRVTLSASLIAASIKRSTKYDYVVEEHTEASCSIRFYQEGSEVGVSTFTMADAQRAGLAGGQNWKTYPKAMLFSRAITQGARWYTPDVFLGATYTPDELGEDVDVETGEIVRGPEPRPKADPGGSSIAETLSAGEVQGEVRHSVAQVQGEGARTTDAGGNGAGETTELEAPVDSTLPGSILPKTMKRLHAMGNELGWSHEDLKERLGLTKTGRHMDSLSEEEAGRCIEFLDKKITAKLVKESA